MMWSLKGFQIAQPGSSVKLYYFTFKLHLLKQYKDDVILYFGETPSFAIKLDNIKKEAALEYYKKLLEDIS